MKQSAVKSIGMALVLSVAFLVPAFAAKELQRSFQFENGQTLKVDTERCNVTIIGSGSSKVEISATCTEDFDKYHDLYFHQSSSGLLIKSRVIWDGDGDRSFFDILRIKTGGNRHIEQLNLTISVPATAEIRVENSRGKVSISKIDGPVCVANSRSSSIIDSVQGPVDIQSSRGTIKISGAMTGGRVVNSRADIHLENSSGEFTVENSRGNTYIDNLRGQLHGSSSRGNLSASFVGQPTGDCDLSSSRGNLELGVAENAGTRITATVKRGNLYSDHPFLYENESGGVIETGHTTDAPELKLSASRGSISIKALDI